VLGVSTPVATSTRLAVAPPYTPGMLGSRSRSAIVWIYLTLIVCLAGVSAVLAFFVPVWMTLASMVVEMGLLSITPRIERALGVRVLHRASGAPASEPPDP
jgi:hypothetical protein